MPKYIFVTGGVASSLGKGIAAASIGLLLKNRGLRVTLLKFDPYINVDPGTMSPYQHGEVFVTEDGAETDLDLGHYERFLDENLSQDNNVTAGQIYSTVIEQERRGEFLGKTIQVVPHITGEIKNRIRKLARRRDVVITEIGGTVGDIEGQPFLEAARQMHLEEGKANVLYVHLTLVPLISAALEYKTKPTQHSVKELLSIGIQPDIIICRAPSRLSNEAKQKIALFCNVRREAVIDAPDVCNVYEVPLVFYRQKLDQLILRFLGLNLPGLQLAAWEELLQRVRHPKGELDIALVGKYVRVRDAYKSVTEALNHAAIANQVKVNVRWIEADSLTKRSCEKVLQGIGGVIVPGGFGARGMAGKIAAIRFCRERKMPYLGLCVGLQTAVIEFARNVCGLRGANSTEFDPSTRHPVIFRMPSQRRLSVKGHTMRLGAFPCVLTPGSRAAQCYASDFQPGRQKALVVMERHRHRYELNPKYLEIFERHGLVASGCSPDGRLVEIVELRDHPFFIATQFHPEFKSRPLRPHPLFLHFIRQAYESCRVCSGTS